MATTIEEYRNKMKKSISIKTPTGCVFEIRSLSPFDYIKAGIVEIPNDYFRFIGQVMNNQTPDPKTNEESYQTYEKFIRITIEEGVIAPKIMMKLDKEKIDTHLLFGELDIEDQAYLIQVITGKIDPILSE